MKKQFYSHLIAIEFLEIQLDTLKLSPAERQELLELAHQNIHNVIIDEILSSLAPEDKKRFVELLKEDDHGKIWTHLNDKVEKIEEKIKKAASQIKSELSRDILKIKT
jgi:Mg/Co/Ni transporter MgtE